jgi:hypothetical protein
LTEDAATQWSQCSLLARIRGASKKREDHRAEQDEGTGVLDEYPGLFPQELAQH